MSAHLFAYGFDLDIRAMNGLGPGDLARDPNGEKDRTEATLAHTRDVDAAQGIACSNVELAVEKALRCVVMCVDDDGGEMQLPGAGGNAVCSHGRRQKPTGRNPNSKRDNSSE